MFTSIYSLQSFMKIQLYQVELIQFLILLTPWSKIKLPLPSEVSSSMAQDMYVCVCVCVCMCVCACVCVCVCAKIQLSLWDICAELISFRFGMAKQIHVWKPPKLWNSNSVRLTGTFWDLSISCLIKLGSDFYCTMGILVEFHKSIKISPGSQYILAIWKEKVSR